jgi:hypothetical protein
MMASTDESMMRCRKSFVFRSSASTARSAVTSRKVQRTTPSSRRTELKLMLRIATSPSSCERARRPLRVPALREAGAELMEPGGVFGGEQIADAATPEVGLVCSP